MRKKFPRNNIIKKFHSYYKKAYEIGINRNNSAKYFFFKLAIKNNLLINNDIKEGKIDK